MNTPKIFLQIPKIMDEVGAVEKNRRNTQGSGYNFRGIDDLYLALQKHLASNGVFFTPEVIKSEREERLSKAGGNLIYTILLVKYKFYADDGSFFEATTVGEAMDSGDKSANKAMSAALKYALLQIFCIPTEEDKDTENHSHEVKPLGITSQAAIDMGALSPGDYVVTFGKKYKGHRLIDIGPLDCMGFAKYLKESAAKDGKPLNNKAAEYCQAVDEYIAWENARNDTEANGIFNYEQEK